MSVIHQAFPGDPPIALQPTKGPPKTMQKPFERPLRPVSLIVSPGLALTSSFQSLPSRMVQRGFVRPEKAELKRAKFAQ
jgi:hypothetical protein